MTTTDTRPAPLTDQQLNEIEHQADVLTRAIEADWQHETSAHSLDYWQQCAIGVTRKVPALLAEIRRQSDQFIQILTALDAMEDRASKTVHDDAFERGQATGLYAAIAGIREILAGTREQADVWVVPKVPIDDNPHVRPRILPNGLIRRELCDATPAHTLQYVGQLLAAVDEADARAKETSQ